MERRFSLHARSNPPPSAKVCNRWASTRLSYFAPRFSGGELQPCYMCYLCPSSQELSLLRGGSSTRRRARGA